jgi:uncharacterized repeat protein (TIGR01451 family)
VLTATLGTALLAGVTAAGVVLSSPTPASAAGPVQAANCAFGATSSNPFTSNQIQSGALVPFMLPVGTVTPGATQIAVVCTGLTAQADGPVILGITSPIAGFNDRFTGGGGYSQFALNEFMGGGPSVALVDAVGNVGQLDANTDTESTTLASSVAAGATSLGLNPFSDAGAVGTGPGLPDDLAVGSVLFIGTVGGTNEMVITTAPYVAGEVSISVTATSNAYAAGASVIVPYLYTVPATGANDADATCPPTQQQVDLGLTNCAMAVADLSADEYGFGYVNYPTPATWPASTPVTGSTGLTNPPLVSAVTVTSANPSFVGTSDALPGDTVQLTSIPGALGTFWADPDGSLTDPLTVEVVDSAGTMALLNTTNTQNISGLSIVPDVYYPNGCTPASPITCSPTGTGSGGSYTGGMLEAQAKVGANPFSTGAPLLETIPPEGFNPVTGVPTAWTAGPLSYAVLEPSVAPAGDPPFDTAAVTCTYTCPIPGTTGITPIAALTSSAPAGSISLSTTPMPADVPAGYPLVIGSPTGIHEEVFAELPAVAGATTLTVSPTYNAYLAGSPVMITTLPDPVGAIGAGAGTLSLAAPQTITFSSTQPTNATVGGTYTPTATASSGLPVTITIDTSSSLVCSISGGMVTFNAPGNCVIDANQMGNAAYTAAPQVQQMIKVMLPAPVAKPDHYYTGINTKLTVPSPGVLGNDTLNGAVISSHTNPAHGSLTLNANGSFVYTPSRNFVGIDSFTYTLKNPTGSSTATVTIDVPARADLAVTMSTPTSAKTGSTFTYSVTVTNNGPDPALGMVTVLSVPSGLKVVSSSPTATNAFGLLTWSAASLASSTSVTYNVTVQVTAKTGTTLVTTALSASGSLDPNLANNYATAKIKVTS